MVGKLFENPCDCDGNATLLLDGMYDVGGNLRGCITIPPSHNSATFSFNTILVVWFAMVLDFCLRTIIYLPEELLHSVVSYADSPKTKRS